MNSSFPLADSPRRALVVTFDQLPASILGCYGNEWIETSHLDRLAATGIVADHCWAAAVGPQTAETAFSAQTSLHGLKENALRSAAIQEAGSLVDFSAVRFHSVETLAGDSTPTAKPDQTPLAILVRAGRNAWKSEPDSKCSTLLWVHARGLTIPATPPAGFAELYQDEFEDRGVKFDALSETDRKFHPSVAAGMMSLFDHWLGELFPAVIGDKTSLAPTLIIVTAAQGASWQPLPNSLGPLDELRGQSVQPPLILSVLHDERFSTSAGLRCEELLSAADVGPLLAWWFGDGESNPDWPIWVARQSQKHEGRIVTSSSGGARRVSTADWGAIFPPHPDETTKPVLFHKPEDAWEVNNVAESFPDVVEQLQNADATNDSPHAAHPGRRPAKP